MNLKQAFPTFARPARLFNWRTIRFVLFGLAAVVTLVVLFYAEENWRGKRAWARYEKEATARGVHFNWPEVVPPPVPAEQNVANTPSLAPLFDSTRDPATGQVRWRDTNAYQTSMDLGSRISKFLTAARYDRGDRFPGWRYRQKTDLTTIVAGIHTNAPANSAENERDQKAAATEVLQRLSEFNPILAEMRGAVRRPYSRFEIDYEAGYAALLPHLSFLKGVSQLLKIRAAAELALGQTDRAFDDVQTNFLLADSIQNEPLIISQLVRMAIVNIGVQPIWEGLAEHQWSEPQLKEFQDRFGKINFLQGIPPALAIERVATDSAIQDIRKNRELFFRMIDENSAAPFNHLLLHLLPAGWFYFEQLNFNRFLDEFGAAGLRPADKRVDPELADEAGTRLEETLHRRNPLLEHRMITGVFLPALTDLKKRFAQAQAVADEATIACALERHRLRHGEFPQQLEGLGAEIARPLPHDVITGQPLIYRRESPGSFVLYSVGWNRIDDAGEILDSKTKQQLDWVWGSKRGKMTKDE